VCGLLGMDGILRALGLAPRRAEPTLRQMVPDLGDRVESLANVKPTVLSTFRPQTCNLLAPDGTLAAGHRMRPIAYL